MARKPIAASDLSWIAALTGTLTLSPAMQFGASEGI